MCCRGEIFVSLRGRFKTKILSWVHKPIGTQVHPLLYMYPIVTCTVTLHWWIRLVLLQKSINICCTSISFITAYHCYVDRLVQDYSISNAKALEMLPSCTKPAMCNYVYTVMDAIACIYGIKWWNTFFVSRISLLESNNVYQRNWGIYKRTVAFAPGILNKCAHV